MGSTEENVGKEDDTKRPRLLTYLYENKSDGRSWRAVAGHVYIMVAHVEVREMCGRKEREKS